MMKISEIKKELKKRIDKKRYDHTIGVAYTAASLAMRYEEDINNALVAGLLHDCAKKLSDEELLSIAEKEDIPVSYSEQRCPYLLHGKVGSYIAKTQFDVSNEDILNAIANHTTGRENMSLLEKIIFTADYIEPGRDKAANLDEIRKLAFIDLDKCIMRILKDTIDYLNKTDSYIDENTQKTYDYLKKEQSKNG